MDKNQQCSHALQHTPHTSVISSLLTFSKAHEYRNTPQWNRFQRSSAIAPESTLNSTTYRIKKRLAEHGLGLNLHQKRDRRVHGYASNHLVHHGKDNTTNSGEVF